MDTRFQRLAHLAPSLSEVELRILLTLAAQAQPPEWTIRASSRQIREWTRCGRPRIQAALESLAKRCIITMREGTATQASRYRLNFLLTEAMKGGSITEPPTAEKRGSLLEPGSMEEPRTGSPAKPGTGSTTEPLPFENTEVESGHTTAFDIDTPDFDLQVIDRLLKATPKNADAGRMEEARRWLHGYAAKFPAPDNESPHPPDAHITAQFLAIAPWPRLEGLLYELMAERKQCGYSYAWFITVALQRIHGIQPTKLKEHRAKLRLMRRATQATAESDSDAFAKQLLREAAERVKVMK